MQHMGKEAQHRQSNQSAAKDQQGKGAKTIDDRRPEMASQLSMLDMIRNSPVQQKAWESRARMQSPPRPVLQKAGEPTTPDSPATEGSDEVEAGPEAATTTGEDTRTKEQKQEAVNAAKEEVKGLIPGIEALSDLQRVLEDIKVKYGLVAAEVENLGKQDAQVRLEVNPVAVISLVSSDLVLSKGQADPPKSELKQDVKFTTQASGIGESWAVKMVATKLGPEHPQGFGPKGQRKLMQPLPTNRKFHPGDENHYVKGHLLNDNLGGPGTEENLFPITEKANKAHSAQVEEELKKWVNTMGFYIYYEVEVKSIDKQVDVNLIDDARNYVDAELHILAYRLSSTGKRAKKGPEIKRTIVSKHKDAGVAFKTGSDVVEKEGKSKEDAFRRNMKGFTPEVSTTKGDGTPYHSIPDYLVSLSNDLVKPGEGSLIKLVKLRTGKEIISTLLKKEGVKESALSLILEVSLTDKSIRDVSMGADKRISWNKTIRSLIENETNAKDVLTRLSSVSEKISALGEDKRKFIAELYNFLFGRATEVYHYMGKHNEGGKDINAALYNAGVLAAQKDWKEEDDEIKLFLDEAEFLKGLREYYAAIRGRQKDETLDTTKAHKAATKDYNEALEAYANNDDVDMIGDISGRKAAKKDFEAALKLLKSYSPSPASAGGKRAKLDYLAGVEKYRAKEAIEDKRGQQAAKGDFDAALLLLKGGSPVTQSPAHEAALGDYHEAVELLLENKERGSKKAHDTAYTEYYEAFDEQLKGNTPSGGPATKLMLAQFKEAKEELSTGKEVDTDNHVGKTAQAQYNNALAMTRVGKAIPTDTFSVLAKTQYNEAVGTKGSGGWLVATAAHKAANDDYDEGFQDGYDPKPPKDKYGFNQGYRLGYENGRLKRQKEQLEKKKVKKTASKRKLSEAYVGDPESPDGKHRKIDPHAMD